MYKCCWVEILTKNGNSQLCGYLSTLRIKQGLQIREFFYEIYSSFMIHPLHLWSICWFNEDGRSVSNIIEPYFFSSFATNRHIYVTLRFIPTAERHTYIRMWQIFVHNICSFEICGSWAPAVSFHQHHIFVCQFKRLLILLYWTLLHTHTYVKSISIHFV